MPGRQGTAHLLQLRPRGHLLREQRGLDAVEQALQPAHELSLSHPELRLARHRVVGEGQGQPLQLLDQLRGQAVLEFLDRALVDLAQPGPALLVQWRGPDLVEQLPDHAPDPHDLGGLLDHLHDRPLARVLAFAAVGVHRDAIRADHHNFGALAGLRVAFAHTPSLAPSG